MSQLKSDVGAIELDLVPMPPKLSVGRLVERGLALALWRSPTQGCPQYCTDNGGQGTYRSSNQSCPCSKIFCSFCGLLCRSAIQFHLRHSRRMPGFRGCGCRQQSGFHSQSRIRLHCEFLIQGIYVPDFCRDAILIIVKFLRFSHWVILPCFLVLKALRSNSWRLA